MRETSFCQMRTQAAFWRTIGSSGAKLCFCGSKNVGVCAFPAKGLACPMCAWGGPFRFCGATRRSS